MRFADPTSKCRRATAVHFLITPGSEENRYNLIYCMWCGYVVVNREQVGRVAAERSALRASSEAFSNSSSAMEQELAALLDRLTSQEEAAYHHSLGDASKDHSLATELRRMVGTGA
jgi:hypothetical protein